MALKMPAPKMYLFILNFVDMVEILDDSLKPGITAQLPGRPFIPSDISKLSHHFLLHFLISIGLYDHHAKYQGVFPDLL